MATLHIEHEVTDIKTWMGAFTAFAGARHGAGVRAERLSCPVDRGNYVVIELDFDTTDAAQAFLRFLQTTVWANPDNSPALIGGPRTTILEPITITSPAPG